LLFKIISLHTNLGVAKLVKTLYISLFTALLSVFVIRRISDIALFYFFQADKYKNEPPNALELFKEMHYSKKKGFAPAVQSLVVSKSYLVHNLMIH
jgi:hypothetical protein